MKDFQVKKLLTLKTFKFLSFYVYFESCKVLLSSEAFKFEHFKASKFVNLKALSLKFLKFEPFTYLSFQVL